MNKSTFWTLFAAMILWTMPFDGAGQDGGTYSTNGTCCDPDAGLNYAGFFTCGQQGETPGSSDEKVCNDLPDCPDSGDCTTIPLDGGLGLLALAGGGLATAAMRRRREEEAEQQA